MRIALTGIAILSALFSSGQYFHETLDLFYNLRSSLEEDQKMKFGFRTYSFIKYEETVPNLLDNFQVTGRFRFPRQDNTVLKNTEWGAGLTALVTGLSKSPEVYKHPPIRVSVYSDQNNANIFSPGILVVQTWWLHDSAFSRFQVGLGFRYNYIGRNDLFSKTFPLGYDLSFYFRIKIVALQFYRSANMVYSGFAYKSEDIDDLTNASDTRFTIPDEFRNLSFFMLCFGDDYLKKPNKEDKTLYNIYLSLRRFDYSDPDLRSEFSFATLDYNTGFRITHRNLLMNPEITFTGQYEQESSTYTRYIFSLLAGYRLKRLEFRAGYSHSVCHLHAVDLYSLQESENIRCNKLLVTIVYGF
jgi:hypothetical protein